MTKYKKFNSLLIIIFVLLVAAFAYLAYQVKSKKPVPTEQKTEEKKAEKETKNTFDNPNVTVTQDSQKRTISDATNKYKVSYPIKWDQRIANPNQFVNFDLDNYKDKEFDPTRDTDKVNIQIWTTEGKGKDLNRFISENKDSIYKAKNIQLEAIELGGQKALSHIEGFD